jgi:hypothetical protein
MKVLGIRFCSVTPEAEEVARFLGATGLGLPERDLSAAGIEGFPGAIFPAGEGSWIEIWKDGPGMPVGLMLQIVVDDAEAFAAHARANGLDPQGPMDAHGERIYVLKAPGGLSVSFQSALEG